LSLASVSCICTRPLFDTVIRLATIYPQRHLNPPCRQLLPLDRDYPKPNPSYHRAIAAFSNSSRQVHLRRKEGAQWTDVRDSIIRSPGLSRIRSLPRRAAARRPTASLLGHLLTIITSQSMSTARSGSPKCSPTSARYSTTSPPRRSTRTTWTTTTPRVGRRSASAPSTANTSSTAVPTSLYLRATVTQTSKRRPS